MENLTDIPEPQPLPNEQKDQLLQVSMIEKQFLMMGN